MQYWGGVELKKQCPGGRHLHLLDLLQRLSATLRKHKLTAS
jgi:hypothetical protein